MKKTTLPRRRYGTDDFPNLNPDAIGRVIPIAYGEFENLQPTEIDTTARTWKIVDQAVAEITRIASATKDPLIEGLDYTEDLAKAEFTLLFNERIDWIPANYWFSVEADYAVSDVNYFGMDRNESVYTDGLNYLIDSGDGWTSTADGRDILFHVLGKTSYESSEVTLASNLTGGDPGIEIGLKDDVSRTKIGQSFRSAYAAYVTKIIVYGVIHGNLSGKKLQCTVWSDVGITQVGNKTEWTIVDATTQMPVTESNENEELECDIVTHDPMIDVADILPDVIENVMDKNPAILDATHLANLAADRVQPLEIFLREEIEFGDFVAKLEAGQLWKLIPKQDATYMTVVFEDGEPGNTPHFRDHDFLSFEMEHSVVDMRHIVNAFYAEDPTIGDYSAVQKTSDVARFFYMNEQSMDVETYLRDLADAEALASAYLARYEVPVITATFEVHGWALDLLPGRDKVKLTRARAPYNDSAWEWQRLIKLPIPTVNLEDFPVCVKITDDAHIGSWARPDGYDIRFFAIDGTTELPYERESWAVTDGEATAIFWVKTDVSTAGTYIWCYYGNAAATDGENAEAVWDANFKAVYHMKDATTSTILDSTANNNDGAKNGADDPIEADGKIGKGQDFDGDSGVINVGDGASLQFGTGDFTVEGWVNQAGYAGIYEKRGAPGGWILAAGPPYTYLLIHGDAYAFPGIPTGWQHFVMVVDRVADLATLYVNGVPGTPVDISATTETSDAAGTNLWLGKSNDPTYVDGILDEMRVSAATRSAEWIAYEYANMNPADGGLTWGNPERTGGSLDGVLFRIVKLIKKPESNIVEVTACVWGNSPT